MDLNLSMPGLLWGACPERLEPPAAARVWRRAPYRRQLAQTRVAMSSWRQRGDDDFRAALAAVRGPLAREGLRGTPLVEALAAAAEAARRSLGVDIYDTQLLAALVMLDRRLAEMATGEGKTLAAALVAAVSALAGLPVHVLTVNDYLVARDTEALAPFYSALGLRVASVTGGMDEAGRRQAYSAPVCYVTARELVFDYLRDGQRRGFVRNDLQRRAAGLGGERTQPALIPGLSMAVLDEADSLLVDEAMMPLILSRTVSDSGSRAFLWQARTLAAALRVGADFQIDQPSFSVELTPPGRRTLDDRASGLGGRWRSPRLREEAVRLALLAEHVYRRDVHYVVRDDRVDIIDENTGRRAPGRIWSRGLHGLIELKEGCRPSPDTETLARITYQRFFPRYLRLCGMSGTLAEARRELNRVYGLDIVRVPTRLPLARRNQAVRLYVTQDALWRAVARRVVALRAEGRPVLVGTSSVAESQALSSHLDAAGIPHAVLNANLDADEAERVALAGEAGQITVATNMAGRGTDIPLGPGVAAAGGLHVLCCQFNRSRRIDRQLEGRCARQGDPGSVETWLAADMPALAGKRWVRALVHGHGRDADGRLKVPGPALKLMLALNQWATARADRRIRQALLQTESEWEQGLSFGGPGE
ncbi:DEAD/DEAH box helicase [Zoogloea sp.]|uniref:preprotein translocase subunit SecA n=1 Tax=Zoogloea sp. TaxID=49181 RepID=UPI0031FDADF5